MKIYYILDGQQETGPYTLDAIKSTGIGCDSLIRLQNSSYWIAAVEIEELADYIIPPTAEHEAKASVTHHIASKKFLITNAFKIVVPFIICLVIGSMTIAMGIFLQGQVSAKNTGKEINTPYGKTNRNTIPDPSKTDKQNSKDIAGIGNYPFMGDPVAKANYYRNNWSKNMTLTTTKYKLRLLGGFKGLSITFANNTDYLVNDVVAEIRYIKGNGKLWKTKLVSIRNVVPHSERQQKITNVNRSKSVKLSIKNITSKALDLRYVRS